MSNKKDLKGYVRYDGRNKAVPSSNILSRSKPKVGKWKEIPAYTCSTTPCPSYVEFTLVVESVESTLPVGITLTTWEGLDVNKITIDWGNGTIDTNYFTAYTIDYEFGQWLTPGTYNIKISVDRGKDIKYFQLNTLGEPTDVYSTSPLIGTDNFTALETFSGAGLTLTSVDDLNLPPSLKNLYLDSLPIVNINVDSFPNIERITAAMLIFETLIGSSTTLISFTTNSTSFTGINGANFPNLSLLNISYAPITSFNGDDFLNLTTLSFNYCNNISSLNISNNVALVSFSMTNSTFTMTSLDFTPNVNLTWIDVGGSSTLTSVNVSNLVNLVNLFISSTQSSFCPNLATLNVTGCLAIRVFVSNSTALNVTNINNLLIQIDSTLLTYCFVYIKGGTNAVPTGAGLTAKAGIISRGGTVTTN